MANASDDNNKVRALERLSKSKTEEKRKIKWSRRRKKREEEPDANDVAAVQESGKELALAS